MESHETNVVDRSATVRTERRSSNRIETRDDGCDTASRIVRHSYAETLRETLIRAVREGYAGVDVIHLEIEGASPRSKLDVWQARKWKSEPPEPLRERSRRYDFRYYDREGLVESLTSATSMSRGDECPNTTD